MKHQIVEFFKRHCKNLGLSRRFSLVCLSFIFGVGAHSLTKFEPWETVLWIVTIALIITITVVWKFRQFLFAWSMVLIFVLGLLYYESALGIPKNDVSSLNNQKVSLRGIILEEPDVRLDHQKLTVIVKLLTSRMDADSNVGLRRNIGGRLLVRTVLYPEFIYGDEVELTCKLQKPEPVKDFAYDEYLARFNVYSICYRPESLIVLERGKGNWIKSKILFLKNHMSDNLSAALGEPYASLARGIALGERGTIPREIADNFRSSGLSHILAISGFNITIIIFMIGSVVKWLIRSKPARLITTSLSIAIFVVMVGMDASVVRAAIMGTLVILAKSNARVPPPRITLSVSAAAMLAINSKLIAFDRGFLLSFAATVGIIYFAPLLQRYLESRALTPKSMEARQKRQKSELRNFLEELFYSTSAAIVFTTPLTIYFFQNISFLALLTNLAVVPVASIIMAMSLLLGIFGTIRALSILIFPILYACIYYVDLVARFFARIPYNSLLMDKNISWLVLPALYAIIFYIMLLMKRKIDYYRPLGEISL